MDLDYNTRLASIQRNEKLAEIMRQQAFQPIEVQSYQGIQAPISPLSGLAKVLQAYMGAKGTGDEERIKLNQEAKAEAQQMLSSLNPTASPGRAAVMGMPEIQARPASSFTPMGADFEDNPNLPVAPSGNVETPAVAYQPAVAAQAAIPPTSGAPLSPEQKNQRLVQMLMSGNPYAAPVAKLEYERLGKEGSGPLAEYNLYVQQTRAAGGTPIGIDEYKTKQKIAGRSVTNVSMPTSLAPMFVRNKKTGETSLIQPDNRGNFDLTNYEPVDKGTDLRQQLADAGIYPTLPDGTPNPKYIEFAEAALRKNYSMTTPSGSIITPPGKTPPPFVPDVPKGGTINPANVDKDNNLIVTPTPGALGVATKFAENVASGEASGKVSGTSQAQATIDLPKVIDNADTAVKHVQELLSHPAFKSSVGMGVPGMKYVPGTAQADFRSRMEQIQGGAFLTAIDTLKGTGAITEVEGTKATAAKNRMATATSEKAFNDAAKDFLDIMEQGVKQTYSRAGKAYVPLKRGPAPKTINFGDLPK
jgi:hypothetical protein